MTFGGILLLAVGLAMDATAVAAARGLAAPRILPRHVVLVALFFGGFQAFMPLLGWLVGASIGPIVRAWDHWIAFALLSAIGCKMLWEARTSSELHGASKNEGKDPFALYDMFLLAVATSIDAFAGGVTLPMLDAPIALSLVTIGITTAVLSSLGLWAGRRFGAMLGKRLEAIGGLVLVALATKILFEL